LAWLALCPLSRRLPHFLRAAEICAGVGWVRWFLARHSSAAASPACGEVGVLAAVLAAALALALVVEDPELPQAASARQLSRRRARTAPVLAAPARLCPRPLMRCMKLLVDDRCAPGVHPLSG
jgi:hypothetical protein